VNIFAFVTYSQLHQEEAKIKVTLEAWNYNLAFVLLML
jgi:hypothetical protein